MSWAVELRSSRVMKGSWRNAEHLIRVAALLVLAIVVFLLLRRSVIPADFGKYGHFRPGAMDDVRARPIKFAGHQVCETCHPDEAGTKNKGKHANVACEACHGPLAKHTDDPTALVPQKPDTRVLCARCHEANQAKPKSFPQVATADHSGGMPCNTCHQPHDPKLGG